MKTKSAIILLGICVLTSCKKETEVSGTVYSPSNKPVANVMVSLGEDNTFKDKVNSTDKVTTDSKGFYKFTFTAKGNREYFVKCLSDSGEQSSTNLEKGKANTIDLRLVK